MTGLLRLALLGAPQLYIDEKPVTGFITSKAESLFYYLAVTGRPHTRAALGGLLWPDGSEGQARKNLRDILPNLRRLLAPYLLITRDQVAFNQQSSHWLDVTEFEQVLTSNLALLNQATLHKTLDLYQGDFLDGFYIRDAPEFEAWVLIQREQFRALYQQGLHALIESHLAQKTYTEGLLYTHRLLALEPWDEQAHRQQMLLLALTGQRSAAMNQYAICRRLLDEELDIEPSAATVALYERIRNTEIDGAAIDTSELGAGEIELREIYTKTGSEPADGSGQENGPSQPLLHNLPRTFMSFIGRFEDIVHLQSRVLSADYPLVTLVGEGGIGKTRLALAVAERIQAQFADGVWFVPLVGLTSTPDLPEQLAAAIGAALKLAFVGAVSLQAQLRQHLQTQSLLLILDNFEHLLAAADFIFNLLEATQAVKILVTSRQRLNLYGEYVYRLDGLALPDTKINDEFETSHLLSYASIQLFSERAERTTPGFQLTVDKAADVVHICRFVEGLPLGIELAAALIEQHDCATIAAALATDYAILTTDLVGLPARHQSIQTLLTYSWQFLAPQEAQILARCSVFHGGFTTEAATAITGATPRQLQHLMDQSLLQQAELGRFGMHELIRQYAAEQLAMQSEAETQARQQHSAYFADLLYAWQAHPTGARQEMQRLYQDLDNLRTAWAWAAAQKQLPLLAKSTEGLFLLYRYTGYYHQAITVSSQAIEQLRQFLSSATEEATPVESQLAKVLVQQADILLRLGRMEEMEQGVQEALRIGERLGLGEVLAEIYWNLGCIEARRANWLAGVDAFEKSLQLARQSGYLAIEACDLSLLGLYWSYKRDSARALPYLHRSIVIVRQLHQYQMESSSLLNLGEYYAIFNEYSQALRYFQQARTVAQEHQYIENIGVSAYNLANLFLNLGAWTMAHHYFEEALACLTQLGETYFAIHVRIYWGRLWQQEGDYATALSYGQQAQQQSRADDLRDIEPRAWSQLGQVLMAQQRFAEAENAYQQALALTSDWHRDTDRWLAQAGLAQLYLEQHQLAQATAQVEALEPFLATLTLDDPYETPFAILWTCYCVLSVNQGARAAALLQRGYQLLMAQALTIDDEALRRSFLAQVPVNRAIVQAMQTSEG